MRSSGWAAAAVALAAALTALVAACAPGAPATHRPPKAVTLKGRLLQVRGTTLRVQGSAGAGIKRVTFAPATTPIYAVTAATTATIQPGSCVVARGERGAEGRVTAGVIVVSTSVNDACPQDLIPAPPPLADPSPARPPRLPSASPSPSVDLGPGLVRGQVLGLGAGALAVQGSHGRPAVVLLPRGVRVLFFEPGGPSALVKPSCVVIRGTRTGHTIASRRIVDWPLGTEC